nr:hypothetical protein [Crenobacter cavernae]
MKLRDNKLEALAGTEPEMIVSGNAGCIGHLQSGTATPVGHWVELVDKMLADKRANQSQQGAETCNKKPY